MHQALAVLVTLSLSLSVPVGASPQDVVIVLDNSDSMRLHDADHIARQAVLDFIEASPEEVSLAIILFDTMPRLVLPLTPLHSGVMITVQGILEQHDYGGLVADLPAAIERAVYHLRVNGRMGVPQHILLLSGGSEADRGLLEELAVIAIEASVRIYGLAFVSDGDARVLEPLAQRTGAEYLRLYSADEIRPAFTRMRHFMDDARTPVQPAATPPVLQAPSRSDVGDLLLLAIYFVSAFLILLLGFFLWQRLKRRGPLKPKGMSTEPATAMMYDLSGTTTLPRHEIGHGPVVIGRVPVSGAKRSSCIVIDRGTISRKHASITWRDGQYMLEDHGTTNGTFINDARLAAPQRLRDGDKVRFDTFEFEFRIMGTDSGQPEAEAVEDRTMISGKRDIPPAPLFKQPPPPPSPTPAAPQVTPPVRPQPAHAEPPKMEPRKVEPRKAEPPRPVPVAPVKAVAHVKAPPPTTSTGLPIDFLIGDEDPVESKDNEAETVIFSDDVVRKALDEAKHHGNRGNGNE